MATFGVVSIDSIGQLPRSIRFIWLRVRAPGYLYRPHRTYSKTTKRIYIYLSICLDIHLSICALMCMATRERERERERERRKQQEWKTQSVHLSMAVRWLANLHPSAEPRCIQQQQKQKEKNNRNNKTERCDGYNEIFTRADPSLKSKD